MRRFLFVLCALFVFPGIAPAVSPLSPDDFVTTWKTDNHGTSNSTSITIPMLRTTGELCVDVDWDNDGVFDDFCLNGTTKPVTHDYGVAGTYTVRISGWYDGIEVSAGGDGMKIISLDQWGTKQWKTMNRAFADAHFMEVTATDTPDFSAVTDMSEMFDSAYDANPDTSGWDTSAVTNMSSMFEAASSANPDVSNWNTSSVTDMSQMFKWTNYADPDVSNWDTSSVTTMWGMFEGANANPDTSHWDTSSVTDMDYMFEGASNADPDVSNWDTSSLTSARDMFVRALSADPDVSGWDVSSLYGASGMFRDVTLSTANYERLLVNWSAQTLATLVSFHGGNSTYCSSAAAAARAHMISTYSWTVTDGGQVCDPADDFVTTWQTDNPGTSDSTSITIPMVGGPYDVDWNGDGVFDEFGLTGPVTHNYLSGNAGTYTVRIRGIYDSISFNNGGDKLKIISLDQWGTNRWTSMYAAFYGASNLEVLATDNPDFSHVTSMHNMFWGVVNANPDTTNWDTSKVTMMAGVFGAAESAVPDVSNWDTSKVTNMAWMFTGAYLANPDVSNWDTSKVTNMHGMFYRAFSADPDVSGWEVTSLTNGDAMFANSALSTVNYDALLQSWNAQTLQTGVQFNAGGATYCSAEAEAARANMIASDSWTILDGGPGCPPVPYCNVATASGITMSAEKAYEACEELTVGPDFIAGDGSNVRVSAGREISFLPGFVVEKGASVNTNVCGKSLCTTDPGPMPYGCHSCVDLICEPGGNEECCLSAWDSGCVNEVATVCGLVCEPDP